MAIRKGDRPSTPAGRRAGIHGKNYREEGSGGGGKESGLPRASRPGPRQKCITCIDGGASRLGTAHGESSFLMKFSGGTLRRGDATGELYQKPGRSVNSSGTAPAEKHGGLAPCVPPPPPSPTKTGKDRATRKAEQGLRRSIPKVPKSTDKASIFEKGADAWGNPARQCPIKEKRHGKRG